MTDTILIVDDESSMRQTYEGWLGDSGWNLRIFAVANDEAAIRISQTTSIDLAILDWNLECGLTGLDLLENLREDQPDLVAIMITGYAGTATPLKALRMGVRDYLDKNQELNRENFLKAVGQQLEKIRPARQQRAFAKSLFDFHSAIDRILPLVRSSAILNDPVPVSAAVKTLFRFLMKLTMAADGVLLIRHVPAEGEGAFEAYSAGGERLEGELVPFSHSLAATVISMQEPCGMTRADYAHLGPIRLHPFEENRSSLLLASTSLGNGSHAIFELFDRRGADRFSEEDRHRLATGSELGGELLRQTLNEKHTRSLLFDAIGAALEASRITGSEIGEIDPNGPEESDGPVMDSIRRNLAEMPGSVLDSQSSIHLAEAIRRLASRHGDPAVRHCQKLIDGLRELLDLTSGMDGG